MKVRMTRLPGPATRLKIEQMCACGGEMTPALRYEIEQTVSVDICWTCGEESDPLYPRTSLQRNGVPFTEDAICPRCHASFTQPIRNSRRVHPTIYCSIQCGTDVARALVRNPVWRRKAG